VEEGLFFETLLWEMGESLGNSGLDELSQMNRDVDPSLKKCNGELTGRLTM
jgi:hypothetical protein